MAEQNNLLLDKWTIKILKKSLKEDIMDFIVNHPTGLCYLL